MPSDIALISLIFEMGILETQFVECIVYCCLK